jgi:hypothetical protein
LALLVTDALSEDESEARVDAEVRFLYLHTLDHQGVPAKSHLKPPSLIIYILATLKFILFILQNIKLVYTKFNTFSKKWNLT